MVNVCGSGREKRLDSSRGGAPTNPPVLAHTKNVRVVPKETRRDGNRKLISRMILRQVVPTRTLYRHCSSNAFAGRKENLEPFKPLDPGLYAHFFSLPPLFTMTSQIPRWIYNFFTSTAPVDPPPYSPPLPTQEDLDYADLAIIDLSKASTAAGRAELAVQLSQAMTTQGFFYAINHGYTQAQTDRMFRIANVAFDGVDPHEKEEYTGKTSEIGSYQGYKPRQYWRIDKGVHDQVEHYNINRDLYKRQHPKALRPFLPDIEAFAQHNHFNILHPILRLLALGLELPEDTLVNQHHFKAPGETSVRFMKYYPRSQDEEIKTKNVWLKGHTDIGSVTILWSQPVGGLQILSPDGKWRWVRHMDNALVINAGDALEFLCGGFYPPTRHRVVQPPADQQNVPRLGVFYFSMPDDDVKLVPHAKSPVLQRVGIRRLCEDKDAPMMEAWRKNRTITYGRTDLKAGKEDGVEEEIINGVTVKHYN